MVALALSALALEHRAGLLLLVGNGARATAMAVTRPILEAYVRALWAHELATEDQLVEFLKGRGTSGSLLAQCAASWDVVFRGGNRLVDPGQAFEAGYFQGFVLGVSDATVHRAWCPTAAYATDQIDAIVARHLLSHPEAWQQRPKDLVATALGAAFPCTKSAR